MNHPKMLAVAAALTTLFMLFMNAASRAEEVTCPPGVPSCKIITLSPDEERVLIGPAAIFDSAEFANRMNLAGPIQYFRKKIEEAKTVSMTPPKAVEDKAKEMMSNPGKPPMHTPGQPPK